MPDEKRKPLVVEDDRGLQKQLKWALSGYEVIAAKNRQQAIAELRRHEPPVVLQDLGLPHDATGVEEGFATLREILSIAPRTRVIVVTGNGDRDNAVRAVGRGTDPRDPDLGLRQPVTAGGDHRSRGRAACRHGRAVGSSTCCPTRR